jgi:hypothetical protein
MCKCSNPHFRLSLAYFELLSPFDCPMKSRKSSALSSSEDNETLSDGKESPTAEKHELPSPAKRLRLLPAARVTYDMWESQFTLSDTKPMFQWKPPTTENPTVGKSIHVAIEKYKCTRLLLEDAFIDKSAALYKLLKDVCFDSNANDFGSVPMRLVYPRGFGKTTLLSLIEAVYSPVPVLDAYDAERVKTKISALERGSELLHFGSHPVLHLDLQETYSVHELNCYIATRLERAGLEDFMVDLTLKPSEQVKKV